MTQKTFFTKPLLSWVFYDFANTIFSAIVLTSYFPLYLTELSGRNWQLGVASSGSMLLAALFIPFFGALSDVTSKTKTYLIRTTLIAIFFLCCFSFTKNIHALIVLFIIACFFYHASLVFYNSLLPAVAVPEKQGLASGLGVGVGYLGVLVILPITHLIDQTLGRQSVFLVTGFLFFLCSLPLFLNIQEAKKKSAKKFHWGLWITKWKDILETFKSLHDKPAAILFLSGNFLVADALNTIIFWFMVYAREMFAPPQQDLIFLLMGVNASAFAAGLFTGLITDRFGALTTMIFSGLALCMSPFLITLSPNFTVFVIISLSLCPFALAGIWTAGRKALLLFAPKNKIGEFFGIYGLTVKASILGSLIFSVLADAVGFQHALRVILFPAGMGTLFLLFSKLLAKKEISQAS